MESKSRGFAAMDKERQREIARQGGIAAHKKGTAHEFTSEEAREAGRAGGRASARRAAQARAQAASMKAQSAQTGNREASDAPRESRGDIFFLIEQDHRKVEELFNRLNEFDGADVEGAEQLVAQVREELEIHASAEEAVVYPVLERSENEELKKLADEANGEHSQMRSAIEALVSVRPTDESWKDRLQELVRCTEHHVEEEENEMFEKMQETFSEEVLQTLGEDFAREKQRLLAHVRAA